MYLAKVYVNFRLQLYQKEEAPVLGLYSWQAVLCTLGCIALGSLCMPPGLSWAGALS